MNFNEKLKLLRKEKDLTQEELAERINVSRQAITKWESGEGIPDIENLKQISILFNTTIDELIKEDKNVNIETKEMFSYFEELEIDHTKHFDINIDKIQELNLLPNDEEKVKIEVLSNEEENLSDLVKIKFDNLYNKLDIDIKVKKQDSKTSNIVMKIYLPEKYIEDIELNTKVRTLNISNLEINKMEYDGELKYINVRNTKGQIVLNTSRCDIEVDYDALDGNLEVNLINSTARVMLPKTAEYKTILNGISNKFVGAVETPDAKNIIELNGLNSKLIFIEK